MRHINTEELPRKGSFIDWENSIGYKLKFIYNDIEGELEIIGYKREKNLSYVKVKYKNNISFIASSRLKKCQIGRIIGTYTGEFKLSIGDIIKDNKRDITLTDTRRDRNDQNKKHYKYKCNKCGYDEGWIRESRLLNGGGCTCCSHKTVVKGINDIATTDPWMIEYLVNKEDGYKYTSQSGKLIKVKCKNCGLEKEIKVKNLYAEHGVACERCSDGKSYPEKFMYNLLEQSNINFETQYSPQWGNGRRYDFYLPDYNIIIETHGEQHYNYSGFRRTLKEEQTNDSKKEMLAINNMINKYVIIDCRESNMQYIKNSIKNSYLNTILDLNTIDWKRVDELSTNSLVKCICDFYSINKVPIIELCKNFKLGRDTVRKYLKIGKELGWCDYDKEKNRRVSCDSRKIRVPEINEEFNTINECIREIHKKYNIKLSGGSVWLVLNGKRKHHKNLTFRYLD